MSHAVVMVALTGVDPGDGDAVSAAVAEQMEPFFEGDEWFGDGSRWDWYVIGGRWTGYFALKAEVPTGAYAVGEPGLMTEPPATGRADVARKCDIDWAGMQDEAGARAGDLWTRVDAVRAGRDFRPWEAVRGAHASVEDARAAYHVQPVIRDLRASEDEDLRWLWNPDEILSASHDEWVERARGRAIASPAFLRDRAWNESERMGWFGGTVKTECELRDEEPNICVYEQGDKKARTVTWGGDGWAERFGRRFLDKLPDDAVLVAVDYHV